MNARLVHRKHLHPRQGGILPPHQPRLVTVGKTRNNMNVTLRRVSWRLHTILPPDVVFRLAMVAVVMTEGGEQCHWDARPKVVGIGLRTSKRME